MIRWDELIERQLHEQNDEQSHVEQDCNTFHPSSLSRCERQCTIQKLGLDENGINTLWNFYLGTRQHEDIRSWFEGMHAGVTFEKELTHTVDHPVPDTAVETALRFTGRCDVHDAHDDAVYDFKTRKSWKGFDGASDPHKDQLTTYLRMADADRGQLVYLVKSAPWDDDKDIVKTWPRDFDDVDGAWYEFDADRWADIRERAGRIHDGLRAFERSNERLPTDVGEVPFEPCGCWLCNAEGGEGDE